MTTALSLLEGILYGWLALAALLRWRARRDDPAFPALAAYAGVACLWAFLQAAAGAPVKLAALPSRLSPHLPSHAAVFLAALFLLLTRAFLRQGGAGSRAWLAAAVLWVAGAALFEAGVPALPAALSQVEPRAALAAGWAFFMLGASLSTLRANRTGPSAGRNRIAYWGVVLAVLLFADGLMLAGFPLPGDALRLAGGLLAGYTVLKLRLPDFHYGLRRLASFLARLALGVAVYAAAIAGAQAVLAARPGVPPAALSLALSVVMVALLNPLLFRLQKQVGRLIAGEDRDAPRVLREFSQSITNIQDLPLLGAYVTAAIQELLDVQGGCLFLVDCEKDGEGRSVYRLRGVNGDGSAAPLPAALPEDSPLAQRFRTQRRPLTQPEVDSQPQFQGLSEDERSWLAVLKMEVYIPIYAKGEWAGLLAAGPQRSGAAFTGEALALLSTLADQTAVALENIRLVEGLLRLNNEFRRAYAALEQANRNLERLDRTKSDFISIASHELRTPLTVVAGSSQMLLEDPGLKENAYYSNLMGKVHAGAQRLHEIVDSMLEMAKIDTRDLQLEAQPVSIRPLVESVAAELDKTFRARKQTFEMEGLAGLPPVTADLSALRKVFFHLISNAIKYTPDGGRITVSGKQAYSTQEFPAGCVEIMVRDTGIGIDKRSQDLIFVKFYQTGELALHSSGKSRFKGGGPGLGLAISRGIVEAHGGKIWVESPGCDEKTCPGSQFHVALPLQQLKGGGSVNFNLS